MSISTPNSPTPASTLIKFDFHMHTLDDPFDQHVYHTAFELIEKAASLGYGALAITLHDRQFQSKGAEAYAAERGIFLVPGVEQNIEGAHVLLLNFPKEISDRISTFQELTEARAQIAESGGEENLVVAPHPFFPSSVALQDKFWKYSHCFDAVEISGFYHRAWNPNLKAIDAAAKLRLPLIGNSDTHTLEQFGTTWSEVACERNPVSLIKAIKAGLAVPRGRSLSIREMAVIAWKVIARGYMKWINYKRDRGYRPVP